MVGKNESQEANNTHANNMVTSSAIDQEDNTFAAHCIWVQGLRAAYERTCSDSQTQSMGFGGFGVAALERFNDALDFEDEPVYRSMGGTVWRSDELDFEDEPVYRSLGLAGAVAEEAMPNSHAAWMQSMPPLVHRQPAFM